MLEGPDVITPNATGDAPSHADVAHSQGAFERLQDELKFAKTTIAALNFEIARLKRWRFGQSSESLDMQVPLFDVIVADTQAEDTAAQPKLLTPVLQVVHRVITRHLLGQAGLNAAEADSGAVTLIQPSFKSRAPPPT